jgi:hypothetical protein
MKGHAATDNLRVLELRAGSGFRRGVLVVAFVVIALEAALFALLWRVGMFIDPGADRGAAAAFVALGTAVTLQAMAVVGVLWVMVAMAWTTLRSDVVGWSLAHPWRSWHGAPREVTRAWRQGGWLVLEVDGHRRRWYVRANRHAHAIVSELRRELPEGAWLEGSVLRVYLMKSVVPIVLGATVLGGLALMWMMRTLDGLMHTE